MRPHLTAANMCWSRQIFRISLWRNWTCYFRSC